jgi:hypothetical protein
MAIPLVEQISECEREVSLREQLYPRWIARGTMREAEAAMHLERMRAVLATLKRLESMGIRFEDAGR